MDLSLGVALSLTTSKVYAKPEEIAEAWMYIYSEELSNITFDMSKLRKVTRDYVLALYPQLNGVGENEEFQTQEEVEEFINLKKQEYGDSFSIYPILRGTTVDENFKPTGRRSR